MTAVSLSRMHFPVTTLGPGRRIGIWFQGCSIRCPGCISLDTWAFGRGQTTLDEVMAGIALWLPEADGITISGGEPFDQPGALLELLQRLREQTSADVLVFSGNSWTDVSSHPALTGFLIDAIVTGRFEINETQTLALRGSDNQELHFITPLGRARFEGYDRKIDPRDRTVDVMFDENGDIWFAGIPARADFRRLQEILESQGTTFRTSEDNRFHSTSKLAP